MQMSQGYYIWVVQLTTTLHADDVVMILELSAFSELFLLHKCC